MFYHLESKCSQRCTKAKTHVSLNIEWYRIPFLNIVTEISFSFLGFLVDLFKKKPHIIIKLLIPDYVQLKCL